MNNKATVVNVKFENRKMTLEIGINQWYTGTFSVILFSRYLLPINVMQKQLYLSKRR